MSRSHGGYLCRYDDLDVSWLQLIARQALHDDGQSWESCQLSVTVLGASQLVRFAFEAPFTAGRRGAQWYLSKHSLARSLSEHLRMPVHAYTLIADELEQVTAYGNGRRVGGELLSYDDVEMPDLDDERAFEHMQAGWPLGHLARVLGVSRDTLIRLPKTPSTRIDLESPQEQRPLWHLFPAAVKARREQNSFLIS